MFNHQWRRRWRRLGIAACLSAAALSLALSWHHRHIPSGIFNEQSAFHVWCPGQLTVHFRARRRIPRTETIGALKQYGGTPGSEPITLYARGRHHAAVHDLAPYYSIQNERGGRLLVRWRCERTG